MERPLSEIDRLDWAARAEVAESILWIYQISAGAFCSVLALLGFGFFRSSEVAFTLQVLAGFAATATVPLLFRWRYSLYALAVFLVIAGVMFFPHPFHSNSPFRIVAWIEGHGNALFMFLAASVTWKAATPFSMVSGNAWYVETARVQDWLAILKDPFTTQPVLEASTGSFWTDFSTYRLLYLGNCWAVAKFRDNHLGPVISYRILGLSAVRLTKLEDGKLDIEIDGRSIQGVPLSTQLNQHVAGLIAAGV